MEKQTNLSSYDFTNAFKELPVKNRASLIITARNLLRQQKEDRASFADLMPSSALCKVKSVLGKKQCR